MADMLVNLLNLPEDTGVAQLKQDGILIRRVKPFELSILRRFIIENFSERWADEASVSLKHDPATCFIATHEGQIIGFAAYECTTRDYFGPTGVNEKARGKGVGKALLLACMHAMREMGYVYAIIGGAGPTGFYSKACGAVPIAENGPSFYADVLK
ncbi:GNAT family N-acetyltransferase [bacterium]|nr:GNAT family N-acetyltransferase [bacterium]